MADAAAQASPASACFKPIPGHAWALPPVRVARACVCSGDAQAWLALKQRCMRRCDGRALQATLTAVCPEKGNATSYPARGRAYVRVCRPPGGWAERQTRLDGAFLALPVPRPVVGPRMARRRPAHPWRRRALPVAPVPLLTRRRAPESRPAATPRVAGPACPPRRQRVPSVVPMCRRVVWAARRRAPWVVAACPPGWPRSPVVACEPATLIPAPARVPAVAMLGGQAVSLWREGAMPVAGRGRDGSPSRAHARAGGIGGQPPYCRRRVLMRPPVAVKRA